MPGEGGGYARNGDNGGYGGKPCAKAQQFLRISPQTSSCDLHTICAFGEGSSWPVQGLLRHFRKEIEERNNFEPTIKKLNEVPYLVDQHLLDKKNA